VCGWRRESELGYPERASVKCVIRQDMAYSLRCYWKSDEYIFVLDQPPSSVPRAGGLADCVYLTARRVSQTSTSSIAHQSACSICRGCPRLVVGYGAVYGAAACLMASTARSALGASWKRRISMHHLQPHMSSCRRDMRRNSGGRSSRNARSLSSPGCFFSKSIETSVRLTSERSLATSTFSPFASFICSMSLFIGERLIDGWPM
jgi:hypothetical protein